ncbi:putative triacylglycerol lipase [Rosa chinensis]|uniref:Putative triacylglycerol lipase n=1 Tax=Rosa chinensis TaxID=74649 RepID=A0A2P6RLJ3_ROSCH|nr:putative triacylglycerol lipase [Rosa chinensis]
MAKAADLLLCVSSFSLLVIFHTSLVVLVAVTNADDQVAPKPAAIFIFGDSTVDVGMHQPMLLYLFLVVFFLYACIVLHYAVRLFRYKRSPQPFLYSLNHQSTFKRDILQGVNFASGGSGIFNQTGKKDYGEVVPLGDQVKQFATVRGNITELIGLAATEIMFSKSLFVISIGSNDLFELVKWHPNITSLAKDDDAGSVNTIDLYNLGARKFGIISVPPIGCCPAARVGPKSNDSSVCVEELNNLASTFLAKTEDLLQKLSSELKGLVYSLGNAYEMTMSILEDPLAFGFKDTQSACCGSGKLNGVFPCFFLLGPNLCPNRREVLFWDLYHPTEYASELAALTLYGGGTRYVTPINFSQLGWL